MTEVGWAAVKLFQACRSHRGDKGHNDRSSSKCRERIEQSVSKLMRFKRTALRYEKTAMNYVSTIALTLTLMLVNLSAPHGWTRSEPGGALVLCSKLSAIRNSVFREYPGSRHSTCQDETRARGMLPTLRRPSPASLPGRP